MPLTTVPTIDPALPAAPNPTDSEAAFDASAYAFTNALAGFGNDLKAIADVTFSNAQYAETVITDTTASALAAANSAASTATAAANTATTQASNSAASALDAQTAEANTQSLYVNAGSMLGINFGAFTLTDGELIVTHLTTSTPSLVDGDLILTYETL